MHMNNPAQILVIDDDPSIRKSLARYLRYTGFGIHAFEAAEPVMTLDISQFDCAIVDIHLPGKNGLELVDHLRAVGYEIPVIFITANDLPENEQSRIQKSDQLIQKPFDIASLEQALTHVLGTCLSTNPDQLEAKIGSVNRNVAP